MAVDKTDSGKGAASIDIEKIAGTGKTDDVLADDDDLDLGNDVETDDPAGGGDDDLTDEERAAALAKKAAKKAPTKKKAAAKKDDADADEELDDEDEEETEDADDEEEEEPEEKPKPKMIPAKQMARVKAKRIAAENALAEANDRIAALEKKAAGDTDLVKFQEEMDQLYTDVELARTEGDAAKAAKLQRKIDDRRDAANRQQTAYIAANEAAHRQNAAAYDAFLEQVEILVPALNPDHDDYDEDVADEVGTLMQGLVKTGKYTPAQSLKKAVKAVVGNVFEKKTETVVEKKTEPKKTDIAKNAAAAKKTPAEPVKEVRTEKSKGLDPKTLTDAEFDALPDSTVRKLRGDFIED